MNNSIAGRMGWSWIGFAPVKAGAMAGVMLLGLVTTAGYAQSCTTQARMAPAMKAAIADAGLMIASSVKNDDAAGAKAAAVPEFAGNFGTTADLIHRLAANLGADTLSVTQVYALDASTRKPGDSSDADFSCALSGSSAETDFTIPALPPGMYGFVMVEAKGTRPYLLAMLLRREGTAWKLAGFYPRSRTAAGHDGLWYWHAARDDNKARQPWFSWLLYGEADTLLRPANFVTSSNLDRLRSEERLSQPAELADGLGPETPLLLKSDGTTYRFTSIAAEGSDDNKRLNLTLHYTAEPIPDVSAARARNTLVAKAFLDAHKELRQGFDGVIVFAESAGQPAFTTEQTIGEIP